MIKLGYAKRSSDLTQNDPYGVICLLYRAHMVVRGGTQKALLDSRNVDV